MIPSPSKLICNTVCRLGKSISCSWIFNDPTRNCHYCQSPICTSRISQEGKNKNEMTYEHLMNILKNTNTQDFFNNCEKSVSNEKATAIKILSLMQIPPGVDFQQTIEVLDWWTKLKAAEEQQDQEYDEERIRLHGPDSAAAHFFIDRQATVRLKDSKDWIGGGIPSLKRCVKGYFVNAERGERDYLVEAIDCSHFHNSGIGYEGLQYLTGLNFLKHLSLQNQTNIDAFCLDRIAGQNGQTIEFLDLTGINLDIGCIVALSRMHALKELVVTEPEYADVRSDLMMLKRNIPGLTIRIMENHRREGRVSTRSAPRPVVYHPRVCRGNTRSAAELRPPFN